MLRPESPERGSGNSKFHFIHTVAMNTENNTEKQDTAEDPLSFLNSLPEVKKKPEPDVFAEHLAFLESLKRTKVEEAPAPKQKKVPVKSKSKKKPTAPKPKKKTNTQLQREEKNRLEREKAAAKKSDMLKRQKEAEQKQKPKPKPKPAPVSKPAEEPMKEKQGLFKKAFSLVRPKKHLR